MRRALVLLALVAAVALLSVPPAEAAGRTVHVSGLTPFVTVTENDVHGKLTLFRAYYPDGYVHGTIVPAGNVAVRDLEHFTCINPESGGQPPCPISFPANDQLFRGDPESLGTLGQPLTSTNRNRLIDFTTVGSGPTLQWRTYEHGPHTQLEFRFADGYEVYVVLDHPTHLRDVRLVTQRTTPTAVTHAASTPTDED